MTGTGFPACRRYVSATTSPLASALGTLRALCARGATGREQHLDVSALDAARLANYREPLRWEFQQAVALRRGSVAPRGRSGVVETIWRCADGAITWFPR